MLTPNEQGAAPPTEPAQTAADVIAPPLDVAAVTPNKKPNQRFRMRRRMGHMQTEIDTLRAERDALLAAKARENGPDGVVSRKAYQAVLAERDELASMLEDAVASLRMYRASNFPKQKDS